MPQMGAEGSRHQVRLAGDSSAALPADGTPIILSLSGLDSGERPTAGGGATTRAVARPFDTTGFSSEKLTKITLSIN